MDRLALRLYISDPRIPASDRTVINFNVFVIPYFVIVIRRSLRRYFHYYLTMLFMLMGNILSLNCQFVAEYSTTELTGVSGIVAFIDVCQ